ncbi:hypothetical protein SAMN02982985_04262 [Rugamonas rubra]|uniref:Uncharacterized protein n=1 Tax=Rugamonas rubra TaxID=758825 RepID=A0A1I4R9V4_9BURK|nr:hypothetical protein SAMN02982985_04262 [Rugamonas rubra]
MQRLRIRRSIRTEAFALIQKNLWDWGFEYLNDEAEKAKVDRKAAQNKASSQQS